MAKIQKIKGLNEKEQRLLETLADQKPYTLKELRELFRHTATRHLRKQEGKHPRGWNSNLQAHSYVRNSALRVVSASPRALLWSSTINCSKRAKSSLRSRHKVKNQKKARFMVFWGVWQYLRKKSINSTMTNS